MGVYTARVANNESSEVVDILLHVTFYFNPLTKLNNVKNFWRFDISHRWLDDLLKSVNLLQSIF